MRRRNKTQKYKGALFEQLESGWAYSRSAEDETDQKTRQRDKTQGSKQGKQIINQNIRVLTPLVQWQKNDNIGTSINGHLHITDNLKQRTNIFVPKYSMTEGDTLQRTLLQRTKLVPKVSVIRRIYCTKIS